MKKKPLPVQLAPIAPCPLHEVPCEERAFILFVVSLGVLENCDDVPPEPSPLQSEKDLILSVSPHSAGSPAL